MGRREPKRFRGTEQRWSLSPLPFGGTAAPGPCQHWVQLLPSPAGRPGPLLPCTGGCPAAETPVPAVPTRYGCPCHQLGVGRWGVLPFVRRRSGDQARATLLPVLPAGSVAEGNAALLLLPPLCPLQGGAVGQ